MTVGLTCPACGFAREVPAERIPAGAATVTCPQCRQRFPLPPRPEAATAPPPMAPEPAATRTLGQLFDQAWAQYRRRWPTLLGLLLVTYLLVLVPIGLGLAAGGAASLWLPELKLQWLLLLGALCGLAVGLLLMFWGYAAYTAACLDAQLDFGSAMKRGRPLASPLLWGYSLAGLIACGAFFLFFIPGVIVSVWFAFVALLLVDTRLRGTAALRESRRLVAGHWWDVCLKFLVASLVPSAIGAVPLLGPLLALAAAPFATLMMVMVYRDQQALAAQAPPPEPLAWGPASWWGMALAGYALLAIPVLFLLSRLC